MMPEYFYLASPYTHKRASRRDLRAAQVTDVCARLYDEGRHGFCPIAHSHVVALRMSNIAYRESYAHWMRIDLPILRTCEVLYVLTLAGWQDSIGVAREIREANDYCIPVRYINIIGKITDFPESDHGS